MATAHPNIDDYVDDYDLTPIAVCDPHEQEMFDEWLLQHSLHQLENPHSSIALRWQVIHWIFTIPFVSRAYADPKLRQKLDTAIQAYRDSLEGRPEADLEATVFSVEVPSMDLKEVAFSITDEFSVIPHAYSFEAVCMRLQVDPEVMRQHVTYRMRVCGIAQLIEDNEMAVRAKCDAPEVEQMDLVGAVDYSDLKTFIQPITLAGIHRPKHTLKVVDEDMPTETLFLFPEMETESVV